MVILDRAAAVARLGEVIGQGGVEVLEAVGENLLHALPDHAVELAALTFEERTVGRFADQVMSEEEFEVRL